MKPVQAILLCALVASSCARPRQNDESDSNRLDQPLTDPELRRTLLRVFAESLKAAAEAGIIAAKKADSGTTDLRPPQSEAFAEDGFSTEQPQEELLLLSGDSSAQGRSLEPAAAAPEQGEQPAESREASVSSVTTEQLQDSVEATNGLSSPAPSPAPPQPTVTLENLNNVPQSDSADVQRFVDAVSNSPDEKLGDGVELLRAPLIAAYALQQEEQTGKTRNLFAYPIPSEVSEQLLRDERLTLSVAGQVAGTQGVTFRHHPTPEVSFVNAQGARPISLPQQPQQQQQQQQRSFSQQQQQVIVQQQRSLPLNQQQQTNFFESNDALRTIEKRQQQLQEQLVALQRERASLLQRQRPTRSETLVPAESNNVSITRSLPIYLQPPFF